MSEETPRKLPVTWRDYIRDIGETISIVRWAIGELNSSKAKKWVWRMFIGMVISIFAYILQPKFISNRLVAS